MRQYIDHLLRTVKVVLLSAVFMHVSSAQADTATRSDPAIGEEDYLAHFESPRTDKSNADRTIAMVEFPPFAMWVDGKPAGVFPDFVRELDKRTGERTHIMLVAVNRLLRMLEVGTADYTLLPEGPLVTPFFAPLSPVGNVGFMVWPRKGVKIRHSGDMQGLVYAAFRNGYFARIFDDEPLMEYMPIDRFPQAVHLITKGRVDALAGAAGALLQALDDAAVEPRSLGEPFVYEVGEIWLYLAPGKSIASVGDKLVPVLQQMREEKRYQVHRARYIDDARLPAFQSADR